jgi:Ni,Fe-hydrogenase III large subunit/Ni,Fe-hydrogenase III component G
MTTLRTASGELTFERAGGAVPAEWATVDTAQWRAAAQAMASEGATLVSLWGSDRRDLGDGLAIMAAYSRGDRLLGVRLLLRASPYEFPSISSEFPAANRMQRALYDLLGARAQGDDDERAWLRHGAWPAEYFPLRRDADGARSFAPEQEHYAFVAVTGEGVHEIAVGPVHAGIIEPGHFRFSVVGEKVLRLEERLGYVHKGIDKRFEGMPLDDAVRLAGRMSGDSTVAYAWAYSMAAESALGVTVPARATWLRALMLERERVGNHLGDLGALGNDAALAAGLAQFSRLREQWLRANDHAFGHRLMMDCIVPGGTQVDPDGSRLDDLRRQCAEIAREVATLRTIYDEHAGLQDRFLNTGVVTPELASQLGLRGLAGRASGQGRDVRVDARQAPYGVLDVKAAVDRRGDVAARAAVRFDEIFESLRLIEAIVQRLPAGDVRCAIPPVASDGVLGVGWVEGWRGDVLTAVEVGTDGRLRRCHCHDPSWQNWPVLEHAVIGNIVPDFPLINKSFNLSYSGVDR